MSVAAAAIPDYFRVTHIDGTLVIYDNGKITTIPPKEKDNKASDKND